MILTLDFNARFMKEASDRLNPHFKCLESTILDKNQESQIWILGTSESDILENPRREKERVVQLGPELRNAFSDSVIELTLKLWYRSGIQMVF